MLSANQGFTYNKFEKPNDWPKLKDTFDYQYENGKLVGGNEHLYLSGPVTYTKVGNPSIVDNVVSGFDYNNYLQLSSPISATNSSPFKIFTKVTYKPDTTINEPIFFCTNSESGTYWLTLRFLQTGGIQFYYKTTSYSNLELKSLYSFTEDSTYYIEVIYTDNTLTMNIYDDSKALVKTINKTESDIYLNPNGLGTTNIGAQNLFGVIKGSIDLNETYIILNGNLWFYGKNYTTKNMTPVPAGLEYNGTNTPEIGWVYTSNELVKGPVTYTKFGNPKIVDGVASGFSNTSPYSYLQVNGFSFANPFEIKCRFQYKTYSGLALIFGTTNENGAVVLTRGGIRVQLYSGKRIIVSNTMIDNTWYKFLYTYDGDRTYSLSLYDDNNTLIGTATDTSDTALPATDSIRIGSIRGSSLGVTFTGSIDLNQTHIKVNGQAWFGSVSKFQEFISAPQGTMIGKDDSNMLAVETSFVDGEILEPKLVGPASYTTVGSPTISNGVVSGFSASDCVALTSAPDLSVPFEIVISFTKLELVAEYSALFDSRPSSGQKGCFIYLRDNNRIQFVIGNGGNDWAVQGTLINSTVISSLNIGIKYYFKLVFDGGSYTGYIKTDNTDWITGLSISSTETATDLISNPRFGSKTGGWGSYFNGSIDLNNTYIKVNNGLWFGKEDWTPCTYKDNSIYLLSGHKSDYSNYNELGFTPSIKTDSDELGSYNVWIDNQKIRSNMSQGTHIDWSKLALTTGYNITIPNSLKAHSIKIEPINELDIISSYNCSADYEIENNKLVWGNPSIYLQGNLSMQTIVGSPSISGDILSNMDGSNYIASDVVLDASKPFEAVFDIILDANTFTSSSELVGYVGGHQVYVMKNNLKIELNLNGAGWLTSATALTLGASYKIKYVYDGTDLSLYIDSGSGYQLDATKTGPLTLTSGICKYGGGFEWKGTLNLANSYIKGAQISTVDIPVPANFTYGNTTTSAIGWVNKSTQIFRAAPEGTIYNK